MTRNQSQTTIYSTIVALCEAATEVGDTLDVNGMMDGLAQVIVEIYLGAGWELNDAPNDTADWVELAVAALEAAREERDS